MSQKILQINFKFTTPVADHLKLVAPLADPIAATPGLTWKVWMLNEKDHEAGGIYLFRDEASMNDYLHGEIVAGMKKETSVKDISVKMFDVVEDLTRKTRGPIKEAVAA